MKPLEVVRLIYTSIGLTLGLIVGPVLVFLSAECIAILIDLLVRWLM